MFLLLLLLLLDRIYNTQQTTFHHPCALLYRHRFDYTVVRSGAFDFHLHSTDDHQNITRFDLSASFDEYF